MRHRPSEIRLRRKNSVLEVCFVDSEKFSLPFEYLRVYSPSAEVKGHGPGQEVLQVGKEKVQITHVEPVGNYAVRLIFDDGHDTGLYSWDYLYNLGATHNHKWQEYLDRLKEAGHKRLESCE